MLVRGYSSVPRRPALLMLSTAATLLGCSSAESVQPAQGSMSATMSEAAQLGDRFGSCSEAPGESPGLLMLEGAQGWIHVARVRDATRQPDGTRYTFPAVLESAPDSSVAQGSQVTLEMHSSYWPGIDWALKNRAEVWLPLSDLPRADSPGKIISAVIFPPGGGVFFAGDCGQEVLGEQAAAVWGERADDELKAARRLTGPELQSSLGLSEEQPPGETWRLLNPADVEVDVLEAMDQALITATLDASIPKEDRLTICPKSRIGWNDCVLLDQPWNKEVAFQVYFDAQAPLEFWLMDEGARLDNPVAKLGAVAIPAKLRSGNYFELDITISARSFSPTELARDPANVVLDRVSTSGDDAPVSLPTRDANLPTAPPATFED